MIKHTNFASDNPVPKAVSSGRTAQTAKRSNRKAASHVVPAPGAATVPDGEPRRMESGDSGVGVDLVALRAELERMLTACTTLQSARQHLGEAESLARRAPYDMGAALPASS